MARGGAGRRGPSGAARRAAARARVSAEHVAAPRVRLRAARGPRNRTRVCATAKVRAPPLGALRLGGVLQLRSHASGVDDRTAQGLTSAAAFEEGWATRCAFFRRGRAWRGGWIVLPYRVAGRTLAGCALATPSGMELRIPSGP